MHRKLNGERPLGRTKDKESRTLKTELLECITPGELRREIGALIAKEGSQGKAAAKIGVPQSTLSQFMKGYEILGRKILAYFGLEARKVFILVGDKATEEDVL